MTDPANGREACLNQLIAERQALVPDLYTESKRNQLRALSAPALESMLRLTVLICSR